jgi:hypothetical protein
MPRIAGFSFQQPRREAMPFQPGQSGNPAGRPRGARNKTTILLEELIERDGETLAHQFIEQAKAGNARALGCLMGMILPKRKGVPVEIDLPVLEKAADAPVAIAAIIAAVCRGELTPDEGMLLTRMVLFCGQRRRSRSSSASLSGRLTLLQQKCEKQPTRMSRAQAKLPRPIPPWRRQMVEGKRASRASRRAQAALYPHC